MLFGELLGNWSRIRSRLGRIRALSYFGLAIALVLIAPFGTVEDPWPWRLAYWMLIIGLFDLLLIPLALAGVRRVSWIQDLPYTVGMVLMPLVLAVPMTALVIAIDQGFAGLICGQPSLLSGPSGAELARACDSFNQVSTLEMYGNVLAICVLAGGLLFLITGGFKAFDQQVTPAQLPGLRFLSRLPVHIGTEISYLQMQDHYLRVVTRRGEAMILMPMRDAIAELEGVEGLQVHRSWWVALGDVVQVGRDGRKTLAIMKDGTRIPVSETFKARLRERTGL